jgi:hypothetical protein
MKISRYHEHSDAHTTMVFFPVALTAFALTAAPPTSEFSPGAATLRPLARLHRLYSSTVAAPSSSSSSTGSLEGWGLTNLQLSEFPDARMVLRDPQPPMVAIPNFLSPSECDEIIELAKEQQRQGREATDYLNYRVNKEVSEEGVSSEAANLLVAEDIDAKVKDGSAGGDSDSSSSNKGLEATDTGGFRVRLVERDVERLLGERLLRVMGLPERRLRFEDQIFHKADPRNVMVRDQTVVHYLPGDGVPPHVDGKDATLLVYLSDPPTGGGGRTVFPDHPAEALQEALPDWPKGMDPLDGADDTGGNGGAGAAFKCLAVPPQRGSALLYWSDNELLHYSERVGAAPGGAGTRSEKYIMQLLLDFNYYNANGERNTGGTFVDWETGQMYNHAG